MQVHYLPHQDLIHLNSNPPMKIAKVLNPVTLNTILPWSFPVGHPSTLFHYLLSSYHSQSHFLNLLAILPLGYALFQHSKYHSKIIYTLLHLALHLVLPHLH